MQNHSNSQLCRDARETPASVLLAYLDGAHGCLAKSYWQCLAHDLGDARKVTVSEWNFEMLNNPALKTVAADEAGHACLVVMATESAGGLPGGVKNWFECWCPTKPKRQAVLVVLLSEHSTYSAMLCPDYSYFQTHTTAGGRHLIVYAAGWSPEDSGQFCLAAARLVTPNGLLAIDKFPELSMIAGYRV